MAKKSPKFVCPPGYVLIRKGLIEDTKKNLEGSLEAMKAAGLYIDGLTAYLKKYADHEPECPAVDEYQGCIIGKCTCGWSKIKRELKL